MQRALDVYAEHREDAAFLWLQRRCSVNAPNCQLSDLEHLDEGLSASLDAMLQHANGVGLPDEEDLVSSEAEEVFVAAVRGLLGSHSVEPYIAAAKRSSTAFEGWTGALGWAPTSVLERSFARRRAAKDHDDGAWQLAMAEATRDVQPRALLIGLASTHPRTREFALLAAGTLGLVSLIAMLGDMPAMSSSAAAFHWARAAVLLGQRDRALELLAALGAVRGRWRESARRLALLAMPAVPGHTYLAHVEGAADGARERIIGSGYVGDPKYAPWLIDQMTNPAVARIAAEAFVHITGADFNLDQLESMPPEDFEDGPSDDPDDDDVELPEDIALPWPDVERVKAWWMARRGEFTPGQKLFLGKPITPEHCVHVLKTGYQRQRVIAAHYRCLIQPGTVLFPTSAPAWRQQRLLAAM